VQSTEEYLSMMTRAIYPASAIIGVVIGVSLVIGFLVIFQSMYTAVMERTREIGILKSMGASKLTLSMSFSGRPSCSRWPASRSASP